MNDQLKTVMLTIPVLRPTAGGGEPILVNSDDLQLVTYKPGFIYGLQGLLKSQFISVFASRAVAARQHYQLVDLTLKIPHDPDEKFVGGKNVERVTMLSAKNMRSELGVAIGEIWMKLAGDVTGNRKAVLSSGVNWAKPLDYMQAYPEVAAALFESKLLPELRLIIMPMRTRVVRDPVWVGMTPSETSHEIITAGEVKLRDTQVRLPMTSAENPGGYYVLPAPTPHNAAT